MNIWAISNHKGGIGKSTTTINFAYTLAAAGNKVLVIDMDPQANTSSIYKDDYETDAPSLADMFANKAFDIKDAIYPAKINGEVVENLSIIHSNSQLEQAIINIPQRTRRETILAKALENLDYDYVLIDNPPSIGEGVLNSIFASTRVIVPVELDGFSVNAISNVIELCTEIKGYDGFKETLESGFISFFINKFDARASVLNNKIKEELQVIKPYFVKHCCRQRSDIRRAIDAKMPVEVYNDKSEGVEDYKAIIKLLVEEA